MATLPSGTVTFLFTDIEGSTKLWDAHPEQMRLTLPRHDALLRAAIAANAGYIFKTIGDAFCAAFHTAHNALNAALTAQQALLAEEWPLHTVVKVRMALHTGAAEISDNDYFGPPLNRVARLLGVGHSGQVLLSQTTYEILCDALPSLVTLKALGEHRLRDLNRPETVYQLVHPALPSEFPPLKSLDSFLTNLPLQITSFIGRTREMADIKTLLKKTRLLTLTGSGGSGKTRLSLQVAADVLEQFPDGLWLVELAPLADPALVPQTVASVLGIPEQAGKSYTQILTEHLKEKRLLLVLDNCEHLLAACAQLADGLLRTCPNVKILASSREGLRIGGELTYRVPSLPLPDLKQRMTVESVSQYESVHLFVERALFHLPAFTVTNQNAPALASICHRLDGIPLAIELAAARVRSLSVEEINTRLDNCFRLLTGGSKTDLPRQQTLRALIDWSYDLLNAQEKALLTRLSVFAGGWILAAAEQVCAGESPIGPSIEDWEVLDLLTSLADKSLVIAETQGEATRYRLLETVRQYARGRLAESEERLLVRRRHRDYFLVLAEAIRPKLLGPEQAHWLAVLEEDHDNLRQALMFCQEEAEGGSAGLRLSGALQRFWGVRGHLSEGRERLNAALAHPGAQTHSKARGDALNGAGWLARYQGDYAVAHALFEESLTIHRELGDNLGIANALNNLGIIAQEQGDYAAAGALQEECLAIERELGDRAGIANALSNLGIVAHMQGNYAAARSLYEESLGIRRELGDKQGIAISYSNLAFVAHRQGDYAAARALQEESLATRRELGDRRGIATCLGNLGMVAQSQGDMAVARALQEQSLTIRRELGDKRLMAYGLEAFASLAFQEAQAQRAARLWGAAVGLRTAIGSPLPPNEREQYDQQVAQARQNLGDQAFTVAWDEGHAMTWEQAVAYALNEH